MNRSRRLYRAYPAAGGLVRALAACVAFSAFGAANELAAQTPPPLRPLAYTRFTLPNGLVAILHEDHTTPIVSVQVWYHVGSKDDAPGHSGWAHLCEHLMSQGS